MENFGGSLNSEVLDLVLESLLMYKTSKKELDEIISYIIPRYSKITIRLMLKRYYFVDYYKETRIDISHKRRVVYRYIINDLFKPKNKGILIYPQPILIYPQPYNQQSIYIDSDYNKFTKKYESQRNFYLYEYDQLWFLINKTKESRGLFKAYQKNLKNLKMEDPNGN